MEMSVVSVVTDGPATESCVTINWSQSAIHFRRQIKWILESAKTLAKTNSGVPLQFDPAPTSATCLFSPLYPLLFYAAKFNENFVQRRFVAF